MMCKENKCNYKPYMFKKISGDPSKKSSHTLLIESTGYDYIKKHKNALLEEIKSKDPQTVWDVLLYTKKVIKDRANQEDFEPIKNYALKEGIDLEIIIDSMAIEFRYYSLPENGFPANTYESEDSHKFYTLSYTKNN